MEFVKVVRPKLEAAVEEADWQFASGTP